MLFVEVTAQTSYYSDTEMHPYFIRGFSVTFGLTQMLPAIQCNGDGFLV